MKIRGHFLITGRVQGVCYRYVTLEEAEKRRLTGWVRNLSDGRVEIIAEGAEEDVAALLVWCRTGPPMARVTDIKSDFESSTDEFTGFTVHGIAY